MAFESGDVPEGWRSDAIVPLYEGKGERTECKNYKSLLSVVGKIYRVTGGLIDDEQGGFRVGRRYIDQIFTLKQIVEKSQEKRRNVKRRRGVKED